MEAERDDWMRNVIRTEIERLKAANSPLENQVYVSTTAENLK